MTVQGGAKGISHSMLIKPCHTFIPKYNPYFEGMAMVLPDDGEDFILAEFGLDIPAGSIMVEPFDGMPYNTTSTLYANVPLESAAF